MVIFIKIWYILTYCQNSNETILPKDFKVGEYINQIDNNEVKDIKILTFNRDEIKEIEKACGEDIAKWIKENIKTTTDKVLSHHNYSDIKTVLGLFITYWWKRC